MGWMNKAVQQDDQVIPLIDERRRQQHAAAGVQYHPDLIPGYVGTHRELERLYAVIGDAAKTSSFSVIPQAMGDFKAAFDGHLLNENVRFYAYMEQQFRGDPENHQLIRDFRTDMKDIARQVVQFIRKWRDTGVTPQTAPQFINEYRQVGTVLVRRVNEEENNLYPLYMPPS